ncbi:MAG TPA: endonuclease/exonuclease/phosphatase family protein [Sphingobacteriaceae bacterium]
MKAPILILAAFLWVVSASVQTGSRSAGIPLKVMTYNIHHANPPSRPGMIDIEAIVRVIRKENPDLVALQEVDVMTKRSGNIDQAAEIAGRLGMRFSFGKAIDHDGGEYGVAVLSRYPISDATVHRLPTDSATKGEPRVVAAVRVALPGEKYVRFAATHLDAQGNPLNRRLQVAEINRLAAAEELPFILAGDLNAVPESDAIRDLEKQFVSTCGPCEPTFPQIDPKKTIDYIAVSKASPYLVKSHRVIGEHYASDHLPVIAEILFR